jgi:hypothetical protein
MYPRLLADIDHDMAVYSRVAPREAVPAQIVGIWINPTVVILIYETVNDIARCNG